MDKIEVSAKNVEEALTQAMIKLGTTSDKMEYEVVSEGRSGFFGIGSRPAVIKAWIKEDAISEELKEFMAPSKNASGGEESAKEEPVRVRKEVIKKEAVKKEYAQKNQEKPSVKSAEFAAAKAEKASVDRKSDIKVASTPEEFITQVCNAMGISVSVDSKFDEEENVLDINMIGEDMGILIGKRGQTLDSLQYLTGLVVNKNKDEYIRVKLDTENYRERRKETLENLARNIAFKVKRSKKPVALEPMNPYERRVIHAALQNDRYVVTRSEGEEPFRHVVISLKRERSYNGRPNGGKGGYNRYNNNGSYNKQRGGYKRREFNKDYNKTESAEVEAKETKQED